MPNITRGGRAVGLLSYLAGDGRANEHTDQRVIAGHAALVDAAPAGVLSEHDAAVLAELLDEPRRVFGTRVVSPIKEWNEETERLEKVGEKESHMWHCSLSLRADEGVQSDETWAAIVQDFVEGMGFADTEEQAGCRWVAIRHGLSKKGNDHVHIALNLVREDGSRASVHNDFKRAQALSNTLEKKYGLAVVASRDQARQKLRGNSPAELSKAAAVGDRLTQRDELRRRLRTAAGAAQSETAFLATARDARVLLRPRFAKGDRTTVVGYSAALVPDVVDGVRGEPIWFSGSKLDTNLGLGQLRSSWASTSAAEAAAVSVWTERGLSARAMAYDVPERIAMPRMSSDAIARLNAAAGQTVIPNGALDASRRTLAAMSSAFAHASMHFERGNPATLAAVSTELARQAQAQRTGRPDAKGAGGAVVSAQYTAQLVERATGADSAAGWLAVSRSLARAGQSIVQMRTAAGQLAEAHALERVVSSGLAALSERATQQRAAPAREASVARRAPHQDVRDHQGPEKDAGRF